MIADNNEEVVAALRARTLGRGEAKRFAHELGVTPQMLSQVLNGQKTPPESMAKALGFRRVVRWERID